MTGAFDLGDDVNRSISQASVVDDSTAANLSRSFGANSSHAASTGAKGTAEEGEEEEVAGDGDRLPTSVWVMYGVSFICQCAQTLTEFIAWFVIKSRGWAKDQNPAFYGLTHAIGSAVPVVMNPLLGWASHATSIRTAMVSALAVSIAGILLMAYSFEPVHYALGYFLYSTAAIRPLRTAYIAQATEAASRTRALAYLNLWTDGAKMIGLLSAKAWDRLAPAVAPSAAAWAPLGVELDRLTLSLFSSVALFLLAILSLLFLFREQHSVQSAALRTRAHTAIQYTKAITITDADGRVTLVDGSWHMAGIVLAFSAIFTLHQTSCGSVSVSNLPVLTERLGLSESAAANTKLAQELLGMPTPLLVAALSSRLSDRTLFLLGILLAWAAIIVFGCPPGETIYQPLVGMGIGHASQTFFFTAGFSMLSKVMGVRTNGALVAFVASFAAVGSTLGNILGGRYSMKGYGTPYFFLTLAPSAVGLAVLLFPPFWRRIGAGDHVTGQVTAQWARDAAELDPLKVLSP